MLLHTLLLSRDCSLSLSLYTNALLCRKPSSSNQSKGFFYTLTGMCQFYASSMRPSFFNPNLFLHLLLIESLRGVQAKPYLRSHVFKFSLRLSI